MRTFQIVGGSMSVAWPSLAENFRLTLNHAAVNFRL